MTCPHCGLTSSGHGRYCPHCGRAVDAEATTIADASPFTPAEATPGKRGLASAHADDDAVTLPHSPRDKHSSENGWLTSSDSISHGRFAPGTILDGRYRIIGLLGKGGMGEVYRADDLRLGQQVALKFLPPTVASDPVLLAQFHNEVRIARQVSHPNICRVYDIGDVDGQLFLSMEFVAGEDLASSLRRIGRFPEDKATDIARQLCAGLAAAHERGVVHRDLKPANVMLDNAGKVRVMDFGLAAAGAVDDIRAGTPAYMAPEQLLGREVTARSDIYALGLVLYELFTGRRAFDATTLHELIKQHQSGNITPPQAIVSALDPAIETAILRCLDSDPARRPATAFAVSAALPGGNPLAAALAAGETPSPQMVAAAGADEGLSTRVAIPLFAAVLMALIAAFTLTLRAGMTDRVRPQYPPEVLAQKARDAIRQIGYAERPHDEVYAFIWDDHQIRQMQSQGVLPARWATDAAPQRPSPLAFWYRRSQQPLVGTQFHDDMLTAGIVTRDDPMPIASNMMELFLDHYGFLTYFEAIPPQVQEQPAQPSAVDWAPLLALAGFDPTTLRLTPPQWNWLATSDTRIAWTGTWPATQIPLRIEAAALGGRPVGFHVIGPWTRPWRTATDDGSGAMAIVIIYLVICLAVLVGGGLLARANLLLGRGDRRGALTLAAVIVAASWILWIARVHVTASPGMVGVFLLTVCTTAFWGLLFWTVYLALEPSVRRRWPQTLVSWTRLLRGRLRDPIVGRDVLVGVALGAGIALLITGIELANNRVVWGPMDPLLGSRASAGVVLQNALVSIRTALLFFYMLFVLRVLVRSEWAATAAFVAIFAAIDALDAEWPLFEFTTTALYFGMFAIAVLRSGLTALTVGVLVANLLLNTPATTDFSAWYLTQIVLMAAIPFAIATWAFYAVLGVRASDVRGVRATYAPSRPFLQ